MLGFSSEYADISVKSIQLNPALHLYCARSGFPTNWDVLQERGCTLIEGKCTRIRCRNACIEVIQLITVLHPYRTPRGFPVAIRSQIYKLIS